MSNSVEGSGADAAEATTVNEKLLPPFVSPLSQASPDAREGSETPPPNNVPLFNPVQPREQVSRLKVFPNPGVNPLINRTERLPPNVPEPVTFSTSY